MHASPSEISRPPFPQATLFGEQFLSLKNKKFNQIKELYEVLAVIGVCGGLLESSKEDKIDGK